MTVRTGVEPNTWTQVDYGRIVRPVAIIVRQSAPYIAGALIIALSIMFAMSCKGASVAFRTDSRLTTLNVEVARTPADRATGLSGRSSLPADAGMIFDFGKDTRTAFWMKGTRIPLSVAFIDANGKVLEIANMNPMDERGVSPHAKYRYAVETNQSWFESHGIRAGSVAVIDL